MLGGRHTTVTVDGKYNKLRIVLVALCVVIALVCFGFGISSLVSTEAGWQAVQITSDKINCSADFTLQYDFSAAGAEASFVNKAISELYGKATEDAYTLFYREGELKKLNSAPNTEVTVDPVLYKALQLVQESGNRSLYLGPVCVEYDRVFAASEETEAMWYDPAHQPEKAEYVAQIAAYAQDEQSIDLQLLGDNRVKLVVSQAYLDFAQANGIESFLDFGWMKNAFITDYIADILVENGYTCGFLASIDGFTRNLDSRGKSFSLNLFDRLENTVYRAAVLQYDKPMSLVYLRNYPLSNADSRSYFSFADGTIATSYFDCTDGQSRSATDNLVSYSENAGCAQIALQCGGLFAAGELDEAALRALSDTGIESIWFTATKLNTTDKDATVLLAEEGTAAGYHMD